MEEQRTKEKISAVSAQKIIAGTFRRSVWSSLIRNPLSLAGMVCILLAILTAIFGYLITPDSTPNGNQQFIELSARKPGFSVMMLKVRKNEKSRKKNIFHRMLSGQPSEFRMIPINGYSIDGENVYYTGFSDIPGDEPLTDSISLPDVTHALRSFGASVDVRSDMLWFTKINGERVSADASELKEMVIRDHIVQKKFLLGTDRFGRDLLSRLLLGTRISLAVGLISVCISLIIGIILGTVAGYFRGWVDDLIMWLINVVWSIPTLLLVIAITLVLGKGFWQVFVAVGLTMWVEVARVVRGQVLGIREKEYIDAARVLGFHPVRIMLRHIIPNVINPVIIVSAANFASAILIEAGLSFLGIGVQPPVSSWGSMVKDHYGYIIVDKVYLAFLPGLAIMIMVLSFTMLGNGLRDALDVKGSGD